MVSNSYVLVVSNSYVLVVTNCYALVVSNSYVWGLVFLMFSWLVVLTFGG